ncbi:MAG: hypothetical protein Q9162_003570 [Coniocarpon cinnabarinum]
MARMKLADPQNSSSSDDELPSLNDLLAKPRPALRPTSSNAQHTSPAKNSIYSASPQKQTKTQVRSQSHSNSIISRGLILEGPALSGAGNGSPTKIQTLRQARTKASTRGEAAQSARGLLQSSHGDGSLMSRNELPEASQKRTTRSPSKPLEPRHPQKNEVRRQRNLNTYNNEDTLLTQPSKPNKVPRKAAQNQKANLRGAKQVMFSTDDDSDEEEEKEDPLDILKGTGIHRKTPRRIAKNKATHLKDWQSDEDSLEGSSVKSEKSTWHASPVSESSQTDGDDTPVRQPRGPLRGDSLDLKLKGLTLNKPDYKIKAPVPAAEPSSTGRSPQKRYESIRLARNNTTGEPSNNSKAISTSNQGKQSTRSLSPPSSPRCQLLPRPATPTTSTPPPSSPGKLKSPSKVASPRKLQIAKAPAPRPSIDAFWAQDVINDYNDEVSPIKPLTSPRKKHLQDFFADRSDEDSSIVSSLPSPTISPRKKATPLERRNKGEAISRKADKERLKQFDLQKESLAYDFLKQLDDRIAGGEIGRLTAATGGVQITWSKKLNSTAGRANWRRERRVASNVSDASPNKLGSAKPLQPTNDKSIQYRHVATIDLASKVVTKQTRLYSVLAHEFCHLVNFMLSRELKQPHGASFQSWARKTTSAFGKSHGVEVTTKHDYDIAYKYVWICENSFCGVEYKRHSKSIDVERHTCGKCRGKLVQLLPKPRRPPMKKATDSKNDGNGESTRKDGGGEYSRFVKEQWATVKASLPPGSPAKNVMKEVAVKYRERKQEKDGSKIETVEVVEVGVGDGESEHKEDVDDVARKLQFLTV